MKSERTEELRRAIDDDRLRFEAAVAGLRKATVERLGLGGRIARSPWTWLLAAGATGAWLGFRKSNR